MNKLMLVIVVAAMMPALSQADWFAFNAITSNTNGIDEIAESQLFMEVVDSGLGNGTASITFTNTGPIDATLDAVYFYTRNGIDPVNLQITWTSGSPGVFFDVPATPEEIPAGNTFLAGFTIEQSSDANPPPSKKGVEEYEYITFDSTYNEPPTILDLLTSGDMVVALHAISINGLSGYSSSLLNDPTAYETFEQIPEPGTITMVVASAVGVFFIRRRLIL